MSRLQSATVRLIALAASAAIVFGTYRVNPILGLVFFVVAGLGCAAYLLLDDLVGPLNWTLDFLGRPVGWVGVALVGLWIVTAPAVLFFDPAIFAPNSHGHIAREPREFYQLISDDVAYVAASRNWDRTVGNLLVPHNTHIVPAWRLVTWALVASAGSLRALPDVLAVASYGILVGVMLMTGRLVAREAGRPGPGLAAAALVGTTSLMLTPAMWFSGGQPLWAGFGVLSALWYAQSFRRNGRWPNLVLVAFAGAIAGGFWAAGHLAGPVSAAYLWFDGRRRCRLAAVVPLAATAVTVVLLLSFAARPMDSRVSFHGRTVKEAADPVQGIITTAQSIPENLVCANLGLDVEPTPVQGIVLTLSLLALWASRRFRRYPAADTAGRRDLKSALPIPADAEPRPSWPSFAFNPLECAGVAIVLGCYLLEWTFRGYMEHQNLRTITPYVIVPWYDSIPQIGAVLFAVGWWLGPAIPVRADRGVSGRRAVRTSRTAMLGLAFLTLGLIVLNRPRVDSLIRGTAPPIVPSEQGFFKIPRLLTMRANTLISLRVDWQRRYLRRLDQAEPIARRMGIGQDGIRATFGFLFVPGTTGRLLTAQREFYDVAAILDLPARGKALDPAIVWGALARLLNPDPEPRPSWVAPSDHWPPPPK